MLFALPCSFSAECRAFPQRIRRWCRRGRSRGSGGPSWSDRLPSSCSRCHPAERAFLEGIPCYSPARCRCILRNTGAKTRSDKWNQHWGWDNLSLRRGEGLRTLQELIQVFDVVRVLCGVRFVVDDVQRAGTDHQACGEDGKQTESTGQTKARPRFQLRLKMKQDILQQTGARCRFA